METTKTYIYGLLCPQDNKIRYVGQSVEPVRRYATHVNSNGTKPVNVWIKNLRDQGLKPKLVILEELERSPELRRHDRCSDATEAELKWTRVLDFEGHSLLNHERTHAKRIDRERDLLSEAINLGKEMFGYRYRD